jgi:hypothetical protein
MISYKKIGGLHFVSIGRFGFSFHVKRRRNRRPHGVQIGGTFVSMAEVR